MNRLDPAIHLLEVTDVLLRTLPAMGSFQSHKACDLADEGGAIGHFRAPDR